MKGHSNNAAASNPRITIFTSFKRLKWPQTKMHTISTSFLGTVFHALSHGAIHFVCSVSFKNLEMEVSDCLLKNVNQWESGLNTLGKMNHTNWKSIKTMSENGARSCVLFVWGHLGLWKGVQWFAYHDLQLSEVELKSDDIHLIVKCCSYCILVILVLWII